jgi:hypothetical protein
MFEHFYYEAIRKTVIAFGTLFNNIYIKHKNNEGKVVSTTKVAFAYGPTQKFLARLEQSPNLSKPIQITTPRMSMEIVGISYDPARKSSTMRGFTTKDSADKPKKSYLPVPYNVNFELSIFTKLEDDMFQIVEQIIPYFQPHYTITITAVEEIQEKKDIKFTLDNISMTDNYEGNFEERRALIWTLKFTAKTYIFLPVSTDPIEANIINKVTIGFAAGSDSSTISNDIDISVTPRATRNYTGTIVTTLSKDAKPDDTFITVGTGNNLSERTFIQINDETLYINNITDGNIIKVTRGVFDTKPQLHVSGSNVLNITTIDNNLLPSNAPFGFLSIFE